MPGVDKVERQKMRNHPVEGYELEKRVCGYIILSLAGGSEPFGVISNVTYAGKFDDVVIYVGKGDGRRSYAMQLKHRSSGPVLLYTLTKNKDFLLGMYLDSYCKVKQRWNDNCNLQVLGPFENFTPILYTNAGHNISSWVSKTSYNCEVLPSEGSIYKIGEGELKLHLQAHCKENTKSNAVHINEFCSKFSFYSEQGYISNREPYSEQRQSSNCELSPNSLEASHSKLEMLIVALIVKACKVSIVGAEEKYRRFMQLIHNWWRHQSQEFITNDNFEIFFPEFVYRSKPEIPELPEHLKQLDSCGSVNFNLGKLYEFENDLACGTCKIMHLVAKNGTLSLACLKVRQTFFCNTIVLDVRTAVLMKEKLLHVWPSEWCRVLALECTPQNSADLGEVRDFIPLKSTEQWQVILITNDGSFDESVFTELCEVKMSVSCEFSHLTKRSKKLNMCRKIEFQGREGVLIRSLLHENTANEDTLSFLLPHLVEGENKLKVGKPTPKLPPHHVNRTVKIYDCLKLDIFWSRERVLLAVTGVSEESLKNILQRHTSDNGFQFGSRSRRNSRINTWVRNNACKWRVIQSKKDFDRLCKKNRNVHWLHMAGTELRWLQSHGNEAVIRKHLDDTGRVCSEEDILQIPSRTLIITAEPDMGKTMLLNHLAHRMTRESPETEPPLWVVFVSYDSMNRWLSDNSTASGRSAVEDVLVENAVAEDDEIGQTFFKQFLKASPDKIVVIVDHFEMFFQDSFLSVHFIRQLQKLLLKWIIVACRPMRRVNLECELRALKISLQPLDKQQCKMLLSKTPELAEHDLMTIIEKLVKATDEDFIGCPLHLNKFLETNSPNCLLSNHINLCNMLEACVVFKIWKRGRDNVDNHVMEVYQRYIKNIYQTASAAHMLFENKLLPMEEIKIRLQFEVRYIEGIITDTCDDEKPQFLHRLYCEYFFCLWLAAESYYMERSLLESIISDPTFLGIKPMWNRIICENKKLHTAVLDEDVSKLEELLKNGSNVIEEDDMSRTALHLAADVSCEKQYEMVKLLVAYGADATMCDMLGKKPIYYARQSGSSAAVCDLLDCSPPVRIDVASVTNFFMDRDDDHQHGL